VPIARISDEASALGTTDIVVISVKTWQLADLGPRLVPLVGDGTLVVPMQNGVEASEHLGHPTRHPGAAQRPCADCFPALLSESFRLAHRGYGGSGGGAAIAMVAKHSLAIAH